MNVTTAEVVNVTTATTIAMTVNNQETDASTKETVIIGWQIRNAREEIVAIFYILQTKEERKWTQWTDSKNTKEDVRRAKSEKKNVGGVKSGIFTSSQLSVDYRALTSTEIALSSK